SHDGTAAHPHLPWAANPTVSRRYTAPFAASALQKSHASGLACRAQPRASGPAHDERAIVSRAGCNTYSSTAPDRNGNIRSGVSVNRWDAPNLTRCATASTGNGDAITATNRPGTRSAARTSSYQSAVTAAPASP